MAGAGRRAWLGALVCLGLATLYAIIALPRQNWIVSISGALTLVALLYLPGWLWPRFAGAS